MSEARGSRKVGGEFDGGWVRARDEGVSLAVNQVVALPPGGC